MPAKTSELRQAIERRDWTSAVRLAQAAFAELDDDSEHATHMGIEGVETLVAAAADQALRDGHGPEACALVKSDAAGWTRLHEIVPTLEAYVDNDLERALLELLGAGLETSASESAVTALAIGLRERIADAFERGDARHRLLSVVARTALRPHEGDDEDFQTGVERWANQHGLPHDTDLLEAAIDDLCLRRRGGPNAQVFVQHLATRGTAEDMELAATADACALELLNPRRADTSLLLSVYAHRTRGGLALPPNWDEMVGALKRARRKRLDTRLAIIDIDLESKREEDAEATAIPVIDALWTDKDHAWERIGDFAVVTGILLASDPCYERALKWITVTIPGARRGRWLAYTRTALMQAFCVDIEVDGSQTSDTSETKCTHLLVVHEEALKGETLRWRQVPDCEVGVDSGLAGVFEKALFCDRRAAAAMYEDRRYVDDWTSAARPGTLPFGAVSLSGWGDGGYSVLLARRSGSVVGVCIDYALPGGDDDE